MQNKYFNNKRLQLAFLIVIAGYLLVGIIASNARAVEPPTADADGPYYGTVGVSFYLDGSGSNAPSSTIILYEWDLDNDGTYDVVGIAPSVIYYSAGLYTIILRVTDDNGSIDIDSTTATVERANKPRSCWGQASRVLAQMGEMGEHASQEANPRLGLRNLARALYDAGVLDDDSLQALGEFVAAELGLTIDACM